MIGVLDVREMMFHTKVMVFAKSATRKNIIKIEKTLMSIENNY
jgi:hypothetical protein